MIGFHTCLYDYPHGFQRHFSFFVCPGVFITRKTLRAVPSFVQLLGSPRRAITHECGDMAFFQVYIPLTIEYTYMQSAVSDRLVLLAPASSPGFDYFG